jgi:glyoxylase-like metal-dependent hydrolase (beta-lactamase superfamily II)
LNPIVTVRFNGRIGRTGNESQGENWFGFQAVRDLKGLPPEILMIPMPGHSRGHCAVAVEGEKGWLLHAGDAYFYKDEVNAEVARSTPVLSAYQSLLATDNKKRIENQSRLRTLANQRSQVQVFCAHDPTEFEALSNSVR